MAEPEIRQLRADEREPVLHLLGECFRGRRWIFEKYMDCDPAYRPDDFVVARVGGEIVSCVQLFSKRVRLRGATLGLGGIGSVATAPRHRRRGLASQLLRATEAEMRRRGMALSLLFGVEKLYAELGWIALPQARVAIHHPPSARPPPEGIALRAFRDDDFAAVRELYDAYASRIESTTVRDLAYWQGQLRYAGNPGEEFRVAERDGQVVAYLRTTVMSGVTMALEFARALDALGALAALVLAALPRGRALIAPRGPDDEIELALRQAGARVDRVGDSSTMWRVLDRARLLELARLPAATTDAQLLADLVAGPRALYWFSDRF